MLRNYIKIAFRNLWKNKLFSFINIMGLGLAIPFALLALLQLQGTFEFDNFHPDSEQIYRIRTDQSTAEGGITKYASSPFLLANKLRNNYACINNASKVVRDFGWELNTRLKILHVNTIYVEPNFFEIFGFKLEKGNLPIEPNTLILSHEAAQRFFGDANAVGQVLLHPTHGAFKVTGVLKPYKKQTQFRSDVMVSMKTYDNVYQNDKNKQSWGLYETHTFVKLQPHSSTEMLDLALSDVEKKTNKEISAEKKSNHFIKQQLSDISPSREELRYNPYVESMHDIYFNFSIPLMILLLAGFNYTNLTLARSLSRSKEVGIRKVMGALRIQLILQFICEAIIIAFFALLIGLLILQFMKQFIHVQWVTWEVDNQVVIWSIFISFTIIIGIVAGVLPSLILSNFQPVKVLKGSLTPASFGKVNFRKVLIVIQFIVTLAFVFQIGHLYHQFNYMATENENFNRKGIFNLSLSDKNYKRIITEIQNHKNVEKIGLTSLPFGSVAAQFAIKAHKTDENTATFYYSVDKNFIENMNLTFIAGKNLPQFELDSAQNFIIINEKTVSKLRLGSPQDAIGKQIFLNNVETEVIGVVKDFCHYNYQFEKQPLVFQYNPSQFSILSIKIDEKISEDAFLADIKTIWKKHYPFTSLSYTWYQDELYNRYYPAEDMKMMGIASVVIFVIALMGLLGMVTYSTEKRYKEIGIRKVMGASVWEVIKILSWSFLKLLLIAGAIALPIGYLEGYILNSFFVYNNGINFVFLAFFFGLVLLIAILTIAYYATKAALINPVNSLRSE